MKIGTSYSDLVNTVGIPSSVSWSSMLGSESFLTFTISFLIRAPSLFTLEVIGLLVKSRA